MPDPQADPNLANIRRVAYYALIVGIVITVGKFIIFATTQSIAVLSDAMESIINILAACMMLYSIWLANRPADKEHPYGHGKVEFLAVGLEGWMIFLAAGIIAYAAVTRLISGTPPSHLTGGLIGEAIIVVISFALGFFVWRQGKRYNNAVLQADGKHLLTDVLSTLGVLIALGLVKWTGRGWIDPAIAIIMAAVIFVVSWRLLGQSIHGLMDREDPRDDKIVRRILDEEVAQRHIRGYHKVRHRHTGSFIWVDMHLQVPGSMSVAEGHELASRIEHRIEVELGRANATAHLEPSKGDA